MFSSVEHVDINGLFKRQCLNVRGKIKISPPSGAGTIVHVGPKINQHFQRLECTDLKDIADFRFNYFVSSVYPYLLKDVLQGTAALPSLSHA